MPASIARLTLLCRDAKKSGQTRKNRPPQWPVRASKLRFDQAVTATIAENTATTPTDTTGVNIPLQVEGPPAPAAPSSAGFASATDAAAQHLRRNLTDRIESPQPRDDDQARKPPNVTSPVNASKRRTHGNASADLVAYFEQ